MLRLFICLSFFTATPWATASAADPVKVFVLAGQSNMQGHGKVSSESRANEGKGTLEWLVKNPETAKKYSSLVEQSGDWKERPDVQIVYLDRKGNLAPPFPRNVPALAQLQVSQLSSPG